MAGDATLRPLTVTRPAVWAMVWVYLRHVNRGFWRSPVAAFFTIVFPLLFLVLIASTTGNEVIAGTDGVRVAQFLTPAIAAFAATTAAFTTLAIGLVVERQDGVLKRVRGTPLAPWMFLVARVGSIVWVAFLAVAVMIAVGVVAFDVQLIARTAPAALLTVVIGIGTFAALGLAVVAVVPSQNATQAVTNAVVLPLAFVSDIFTIGDLPTWLERVGWVFPLKHFVHALAASFDPFTAGPQFRWDHLAVMLAWGVAGALVGLRWFRWEPGPADRRTPTTTAAATSVGDGPTSAAVTVRDGVDEAGRPGVVALTVDQVTYGSRVFWRNAASAFFTIALPVILVLLLPVISGDQPLPDHGGVPFTQFLTPVVAVFGATLAAYSDFSERVATARDQGVLKRIHGTPLPIWAFALGRLLTTVSVAMVSVAITLGVGMVVHGVELVPRSLPGLLVSVIVGAVSFATLGLALAAIAPNVRTVTAIASATLLPLTFVSDIFLVGAAMPRWMETIGWVFPLKHFANAVADGMNPTMAGNGFFSEHLAALVAWMAIGAVVALRFWTWEPRAQGGTS